MSNEPELFDGFTNFNKGPEFYNLKKQFLYSILSALSFIVSQYLLQHTSTYIHHSIDSIYVALAMTLIMPSFILGDYSVYPAKLTLSGDEMLYYFVSGVCTFFFHSQVTQMMSYPDSHKSFIALYTLALAAVIGIIIDNSKGNKLSGFQYIGAALIILPGLMFDLI